MPASMMMADTGSIPNVVGSRMVMPPRGPIPGSTPTIVPSSTPSAQYNRLVGVRQTEKPYSRLSIVSTRLAPHSKRQDPGRQGDLEDATENDVGRDAADQCQHDRLRPADLSQHPHGQRQERYHRDQESEALEEPDRGHDTADQIKHFTPLRPGIGRAGSRTQNADHPEQH